MDVSEYTITNIHRGKAEKRHNIYAELRDENGLLVISATFNYIHDKLREFTIPERDIDEVVNDIERACKEARED